VGQDVLSRGIGLVAPSVVLPSYLPTSPRLRQPVTADCDASPFNPRTSTSPTNRYIVRQSRPGPVPPRLGARPRVAAARAHGHHAHARARHTLSRAVSRAGTSIVVPRATSSSIRRVAMCRPSATYIPRYVVVRCNAFSLPVKCPPRVYWHLSSRWRGERRAAAEPARCRGENECLAARHRRFHAPAACAHAFLPTLAQPIGAMHVEMKE